MRIITGGYPQRCRCALIGCAAKPTIVTTTTANHRAAACQEFLRSVDFTFIIG